MKWPSDRIAQCSPKSFGMYERALSFMAEGHELIHLEVGRPDADTPAHIKEATKKALDDGIVHYGDFAGDIKLREAICAKLKSYNGIDAAPDEVLVTNGLTHAGFAVLTAAVDPGDEVILLEPYYPQHVGKIEMAGGKVVKAVLDGSKGFPIEREPIEACITDKTRMICLVNPSNPTGRVYTREELQILADLAIEHDLLVASDEVYDHIVYDDNKHVSIASLPGMWERTFSMYALTKAFAMDGWRLGYIACPRKFMPALVQVTATDVAHVNVFIQHGAIAAISGPQEPMHAMVAEDDRRRRLVCERLDAIDGITCPLPEGTIYAYPDVSAFGLTSKQIAEGLLEATHVVTEDGAFYGSAGEGHLRVCFGSEPYAVLEEALDRIAAYFAKLQLRAS
ncbi:pyridoxal phosphate-dependent aminotransferase [Elongatibacter sediminis]|uniref:Pyridoxal phosphate-dependent aminotransferase n=1 Tax=Elongatibacter sediminis TaxID=3119006 RepID=A0AAW9RI38_9GAMM